MRKAARGALVAVAALATAYLAFYGGEDKVLAIAIILAITAVVVVANRKRNNK